MTNTFTKDQVIALLADRDNIKTDKDKIDCGSADVEGNYYELTCPLFITDHANGLSLNVWVHQDCRIIEGVPTIVPFQDALTGNATMFSVAMSDSSNLIEDMTESETETFIEQNLKLNDYFIDEVKAFAQQFV